jgi:ABC-2 type transport system ATP-binding protein
MAAIVQVRDLVKRYMPEDVLAVDGVSFQIEEGEILSLLGPNGAGKTTTLSMLSCLLKPTRGDALVDGHSIVTDSLAVRRAIGVVPQEIALYETLSARENLIFWGRMYDMGGQQLGRRVDQVLDLIGLADRAGARVGTYSGGMKRRVNIGVGLLHEPRLLFMDEPTVGIDPQSRRNILDTVKELNRQGMTVLNTTHHMEEAQELSDRVGIIDHGKLIALGTQKELTEMVGEHETLRLHLGEGQDAEALADALRSLPDTIQVSATGGQVVLIVPEAEEALPGAFARADGMGVRVRRVDIEEPNLEAVFLHLTGRALSD